LATASCDLWQNEQRRISSDPVRFFNQPPYCLQLAVPCNRAALLRPGSLLTQPVSTNVTLANLRAVSRRGWLDESKQASVVRQLSERLRLRARNGEQIVSELSGGNQQKVLFGRWLHKDCQLLLLDEPTRGIDVGARADIHAELHALAAAQKAILMVSSDLRELMEVCDRIAVLSTGTLTQVFTRGEWSEAALLSAAFAAYDERRRAARGGSVA